MELSKKELKRLAAERAKTQKRIAERNKRHKKIAALFKSSNPPDVVPMWHVNVNDIDLSKQKENLSDELLEEGFTIIENVDIELLLDNMYSGNREMFRSKVLYNEDLDEVKTNEVLYNWVNKKKLIPPTILITDKVSGNFLSDIRELFPTDGKHRLNVAYYFGATRIPIFVINKQLEKIKEILNLT